MLPIYIYHATKHHTSIRKKGFKTEYSYDIRNTELGAGEATYFTFDRSVAMSYSVAAANESFLPVIIEELEKTDNVAGFLLRNLVEQGSEKGWDKLFEVYGDTINRNYDDKTYDLNDVSDISRYIRGSKTIEIDDNHNFLSGGGSSYLPEAIIQDTINMGISTVPDLEADILKCKLPNNTNIKNIGYTDNAVKEAEQAKNEGFQGLIFKNKFSIDNQEELALFRFDGLEFTKTMDTKITVSDITLDMLEEFISIIKKTMFPNQTKLTDALYREGMISCDMSENDSLKSSRNLLSTLYKMKIIGISENNKIELLVDFNKIDLKTYLRNFTNSDIIPDLVKLDIKENSIHLNNTQLSKNTK